MSVFFVLAGTMIGTVIALLFIVRQLVEMERAMHGLAMTLASVIGRENLNSQVFPRGTSSPIVREDFQTIGSNPLCLGDHSGPSKIGFGG